MATKVNWRPHGLRDKHLCVFITSLQVISCWNYKEILESKNRVLFISVSRGASVSGAEKLTGRNEEIREVYVCMCV